MFTNDKKVYDEKTSCIKTSTLIEIKTFLFLFSKFLNVCMTFYSFKPK